jgi:DNA-binding HxlR family transcriptional regulator
VEEAEFARWSRAVLALLSRAPVAMPFAEIAEGIGDCDEPTLQRVLEEMAARGLVRAEPDPTGAAGGLRWRHR